MKKGKEDAQGQGHGFDTNEESADLTGDRRRYNKYDWLHVRHNAAEDFNSEDESKSGDENKSSDEFDNEFSDEFDDKSEGSDGFGDRAGHRSEGAGRDEDEKSNAKPM
jgi:hypothetical protein